MRTFGTTSARWRNCSDGAPAGWRFRLIAPESVCVVTVTYGDRFHLLERVVLAALAANVARVVVVDNASAEASRRGLATLAARNADRVEVLSLPANRGSAGGYAAGLERAAGSASCAYVWLLDDDTVPEPDALSELQRWHAFLREEHREDELALVSAREALRRKRVASSLPQRDPYPLPRRSSFLGFHLLDLGWKLGRLIGVRPPRPAPQADGSDRPQRVSRAPYGGLFFHRSVLGRIGLPDERLFLYGDDTDFTYRLPRHDGAIYAVPGSRLTDIDASWDHNPRAQRSFHTFLDADSDARVYYSVRNHVHFSRCHRGGRGPLYLANKLAYLAMLGVVAATGRRWQRFRLVRRAVRDGERGRLGRTHELDA